MAGLLVDDKFPDLAHPSTGALHSQAPVKSPNLTVVEVLEIETFVVAADNGRIRHPQRFVFPRLEEVCRRPGVGHPLGYRILREDGRQRERGHNETRQHTPNDLICSHKVERYPALPDVEFSQQLPLSIPQTYTRLRRRVSRYHPPCGPSTSSERGRRRRFVWPRPGARG